MSAGGFGSRLEITYQEIDFGPARLPPEQFSGMGNFLAPVHFSIHRSFDK